MSKLAVDGGTPVRRALLPYGRQLVDEGDVDAVVKVLRSDWLTTGPAVDSFERAFAAAVGAPRAVALSNGTAALHAIAAAANIGPGDEVIVPPMTFVATANAVRYLGGTVVFADVSRDTLNLDPTRVDEAITSRTRAICAVDFAGHPAELDRLRAIADARGLLLLEDACHALGARYQSRPVGSIADFTAFSLHPVKHITTGEGGVVTALTDESAARVRTFRNHGIATDFRQREKVGSWAYDMTSLGFNYRLSDLQCALGESQLGKLAGWVARRRAIAARYTEVFAALPSVEPPSVRPGAEPAWHLYVLRLNLPELRASRAEVFGALRAENIGVNVHYIPVPWHGYYQDLGYARGGWPVAESEYERMLSLPMFPGMTDGDVNDVIEGVHKVVTAYVR